MITWTVKWLPYNSIIHWVERGLLLARCKYPTRLQTWASNKVDSLFGHRPAPQRLKSRNCFLSSIQPAFFPAKVTWCKCVATGTRRNVTNWTCQPLWGISKRLWQSFDNMVMTQQSKKRIHMQHGTAKGWGKGWQYNIWAWTRPRDHQT